MTSINEWINETINGRKRKVIPIMTHPGIQLCGKTVKDAVTNGQIHAEAIIKLNNLYPADGVTSIMDLTVEAEAFGAGIIFPEDEVPTVIGRLITNYDSVRALDIPPLTAGRISEYLKANRLSVNSITTKPVFGGCIGPFSLAGRLFGLSEMLMALYIEPETINLLLKKCTCFLTDYCKAIKGTGVQGVIIAEPAAGLISNDDCIKYSTFYVRNIIEEIQDDNFIVILHNCGNGGHATKAMVKSGAKGLHFGNKIDMIQALNDTPEDILVIGNLDPVGILKYAKAEEVYKSAMELLKKTTGWNNFIISSGCDVPSHIPFDNVDAFYKAIADYNDSNTKK